MKNNYLEKFKDPRWQKKRLEIFERDGWICQICKDTETTLNIHHRYYLSGKDPWEYPDKALITLCEDCHLAEKEERPEYEKALLNILREKFSAENLMCIVAGFNNFNPLHLPEVIADMLEWFLSSKELQKEILDKYFEFINTSNKNSRLFEINKQNIEKSFEQIRG